MAYDPNKATLTKDLKALAQKIQQDYATKTALEGIKTRVQTLEETGGEPNVITSVKVNGTALVPDASKAVDVTVPTKVSELQNDQKFQTETQVAQAVAAADHLKRKIVASIDAIDINAEGADKFIYMVPKTGSDADDQYDEYMVLGEAGSRAIEHVGHTKVDLSDYVRKDGDKVLSTKDYTAEDQAKLAGIAANATKVEASEKHGAIKVNGVDTQVVNFATDAEIQEMLTEVFGSGTNA